MMKRTLGLCALLALAATQGQAQVTSQSLIDTYQAQGYGRIEVRTGLTQIKVEAIRGTEKLEVILDKATGAVLKSETETVGLFDNTRPGVSVRERNRDFVRVSSRDDDDGDDDSRSRNGSGRSASDDDNDDDGDRNDDRNRGGSDDDDDDRDDDSNRGGSDDDDDDGDDDNGGDRSGSDDD